MYKLHLILKYLRRRRIAWVSLVAVMLCTTMVLVVISVMGGWLRMFENSARGLTGDIVISEGGLSGFPYYQEIIDAIRADPDARVEAAVPTIQTFGLFTIEARRTHAVQVWGVPIDQIGKVNTFPESLYRQYTLPVEQGRKPPTPTFDLHEDTRIEFHGLPEEIGRRENDQIGPAGDGDWDKLTFDGFWVNFRGKMTDAQKAKFTAASTNKLWSAAINRLAIQSNWPGLIVGGPLIDVRKGPSGQVEGREPWKYTRLWVKLTMLAIPTDQQIKIENKTEANFWVVDDSHTGMWQYDTDHVYVSFDFLQRSIGMDARSATRLVNTVLLRGDPKPSNSMQAPAGTYHLVRWSGSSPSPIDTLVLSQNQQIGFRKGDQDRVIAYAGDKTFDLGPGPVDAAWQQERPFVIPARASHIHVRLKDGANPKASREKISTIVTNILDSHRDEPLEYPSVQTWREVNELFIGAIEHEKLLVVFLFGIISIVAIFLIFCIFYMIVAEKTKDIGIIKSVGASSTGVAGIFLGYGLTIGIVGAGMGLLVSYLICHYINEIHDWMGRRLGLVIWNPEVYAFDKIPNTMNPTEVSIIVAVAILASVVGALYPAIRAARMHPVEALRWE